MVYRFIEANGDLRIFTESKCIQIPDHDLIAAGS
jgi:hypothetical protein